MQFLIRFIMVAILLCAALPLVSFNPGVAPLSAAELEAVPAVTAQVAINEPQTAVALVDQQTEKLAEAIQTPWWERTLAILGGAAAVILGVAKFIPGWWQPLAAAAHRYLAPRQVKEARHAEQVGNQALTQLVRTIEMVPNTGTIGDLKEKIMRKVPSTARDAIGERVREIEGTVSPATQPKDVAPATT